MRGCRARPLWTSPQGYRPKGRATLCKTLQQHRQEPLGGLPPGCLLGRVYPWSTIKAGLCGRRPSAKSCAAQVRETFFPATLSPPLHFRCAGLRWCTVLLTAVLHCLVPFGVLIRRPLLPLLVLLKWFKRTQLPASLLHKSNSGLNLTCISVLYMAASIAGSTTELLPAFTDAAQKGSLLCCRQLSVRCMWQTATRVVGLLPHPSCLSCLLGSAGLLDPQPMSLAAAYTARLALIVQ